MHQQVETFVFSTSLHRITDTLKAAELPQVLDQLADVVPDWSGGTRIGASLQTFLQDYGAHSVDRNTVVLIASDGWDSWRSWCILTLRRRIACDGWGGWRSWCFSTARWRIALCPR